MTDRVKELISYKLVKTSEEKALKNKQTKLNKKLKDLEKSKVKNEVYDKDLDLNENEPNLKPEPPLSQVDYTVPIQNSFQPISSQEVVNIEAKAETVEDIVDEESVETREELMSTEERAIREKLRMSVKEKVEAKLKDIEVTDEFAKELAIELIYEMEDLVQDKLAAFRDTLDEDIAEVYENQHF